MDDFSISTLHESRNEWCARLVSILTPLIIDGYQSILDESIKLCKQNNELNKYLMTFQNLISRIPKWNQTIIENERKRICERSGCGYLDDLVTCVHVIQMKTMTAMRAGSKQKKLDIDIPKLDDFLHKCYVNSARKLYKNVYLFEVNIQPLMLQKNGRELEVIVQEAILNTIRESIPIEAILKAYMDETTETEVTEEIKEQYIEEAVNTNKEVVQVATSNPEIIEEKKLSFNTVDYVKDSNGSITEKESHAISPVSSATSSSLNFSSSSSDDFGGDEYKLKIFDSPESSLDTLNLEIETIDESKLPALLKDDVLDFEVLE